MNKQLSKDRFIRSIFGTLAIGSMACGIACGQAAGPSSRSVIDNEYGQYYGYGPNPAQVGLAVLQPHSGYFTGMQPEAIKAPHGHFQHFAAGDQADDFPVAALKAFEANEIAAGRPPIFVTANYQGKTRPVYFEWSLGLNGSNQPGAPQEQWQQAVNLNDDRFVRFFANAYLRSTMWQPPLENYWHAADNCAFRYNNYGVIDDSGIYQNSIAWSPGFAQNDGAFLDSIKYFLHRLKQVAPDIHIVGNEGSMNEEDRFAEVWGGFDGTIREDITNSFAGDDYSRSQLYLFFNRYQWEGPAGKAAVLRALLPASSDPTFAAKLRTSYVAYLIFRGPNFFFAPRFDDGTANGVSPSSYASMRAAVGLPSGLAEDSSVTGDGYRFYWRQTEGGIVYLNWTGKTYTVTLPTDQLYYNRSGKRVRTLSIPDLQGDYVLTQAGVRAEMPSINPRRASLLSGPLSITLSTISHTTIHYTLDGSTPNASSPLYTGPFTITNSSTVKTLAACAKCLNSFVSSAVYIITSTPPMLNMLASSATGDGFGFPDYVLVQLGNASAKTVTVRYSVTGGTAAGSVDTSGVSGTLTFKPGETIAAAPVSLSYSSAYAGKTVVISLASPNGASLGPNKSFVYTLR